MFPKKYIELFNPWWFDKKIDLGIKRNFYLQKILESLKSKKITFLLGSRRVGKTFLTFQTIYQLLEQKIDKKKILFLSLDNINLKKLNLLDYLTEHNFDYVFLDEIQYLPDWQQILKSFYDLPGQKTKVLVSGSSSALINDKRNFLTGRNTLINVYSLNFQEFKLFSKSKNLKSNLKSYLEYGGYPEYVLERHPNYHHELLNDIIQKDIIPQFKIKLKQPIIELIKLVAKQIGSKTSLNKMSKILGITDDTVKSYLEYLTNNYVLNYIYKYSPSINDRIYSAKKFYFWDLGLRTNLVGFEDLGSLAENIVFIKLKMLYPKADIFYLSDTKHSEVDFLVIEKNKTIFVEVKFSSIYEKIEAKLSNLFFKDVFGLEVIKRIVVCDGLNKVMEIKGQKIELVGLEDFLQK